MSTPPLRVLVLTHVFPRSPDDPAAPFLLRYVQGLVGAGAEVRVLAPHDAGLPTEHQVAGVPVRRVRYGSDRREDLAYRGEMHLRVRRPGGAVAALRLVRALARAVREEVASWRPDVLDVHWLVPGAVAARLARPPVPVQLVVHGTDLALVAAGPVRRGAARLLVRSVDVLAAASGPLAAEVAAVLRRPVDAVVTMPFDPPRAQPRPPPAADAVLAVGRLVPEKGLLDLVEAVGRVRRGGRAVALTIVGEGPQRPRLEAAARTLRVPVDLPGALPPSDLDAAYGAADLVVVPSHREGFGLVAVEALARLRPVVATTVGGLAEIVRDGTTGWAVPPGDVTALARAIEAALADPEEALRRARTGAEHVMARWSAQQLGRESVARLRALARPD